MTKGLRIELQPTTPVGKIRDVLSRFLNLGQLLAEQREVDGDLLAVGTGCLGHGAHRAADRVDDHPDVVVDLVGSDVLEFTERFEALGDPPLIVLLDGGDLLLELVVVAQATAELVFAARARGEADGPRQHGHRDRPDLSAETGGVVAHDHAPVAAASPSRRISAVAWPSPSGSRKSALPATNTLAPAAAAPDTVAGDTPPSTSRSQS